MKGIENLNTEKAKQYYRAKSKELKAIEKKMQVIKDYIQQHMAWTSNEPHEKSRMIGTTGEIVPPYYHLGFSCLKNLIIIHNSRIMNTVCIIGSPLPV